MYLENQPNKECSPKFIVKKLKTLSHGQHGRGNQRTNSCLNLEYYGISSWPSIRFWWWLLPPAKLTKYLVYVCIFQLYYEFTESIIEAYKLIEDLNFSLKKKKIIPSY
jgi:hypothetical protein